MSEPIRQFYRFGPFSIDADKRQLLRDGEVVSLTPKAFDTLLALVEHQGQVLEKGQLMEMLWPDSEVEEANLPLHISAIRRALGESPSDRRHIVTIPGRGYKFAAEVMRAGDTSDVIVARYTKSTIVVQDSESSPQLDGKAGGPEPGTRVEEYEAAIVPHSSQIDLVRALLDGGENDGGRIATPELPGAVSGSRARRRRRRLAVAVLLVVAGPPVAIYWLVTHRQLIGGTAARPPFHEINVSRLSTSGKITHAAISSDGKYVAQVTEDADGDSLWVRNIAAPTNVRVAGPAATEYVWVTFAPDGDSVYYLALDRDKGDTELYSVGVLGGPSRKAAHDVGPVAFSPDGGQMAFIRMDQQDTRLVVASADGASERTLATRAQPDSFRMIWNAPAWSPDGKKIACQANLNDDRGSYETIVGVSINDGAQKRLTSERWYHVGQAVWLADSSGLLVTASQSATAPSQVWHIAAGSGGATRVTRDLNDYHDLSLTGDSKRLAAVQHQPVSSIWVAPEAAPGAARKIASDTGWIEEVAWTPDDRIVYRSNAGNSPEIWIMNADGSYPMQLTVDARPNRGLTVSPDGRYIFFASDRGGHSNIWRVDGSGTGLKQLTTGDGEFYPQCTPDAGWVVYQSGEIEPALWKAPVEGGDSVQLTKTRACRPAISADGHMIAYHYLDPALNRWGVGVVSSDGGQVVKRFDFPPTVAWRLVRWSPDGQSIAYPNSPGGVTGIWLQPINGGAPRQLAGLKAERILALEWSRDGRQLAFVQGVETSDVVLIEDARK